MKICFFAHYSFTNQAGATLSMYNIIEELIKRGTEVIVVLANTANLEEKMAAGKIKFIQLPMYGMRMDMAHMTVMSRIKFAVKHLRNERCIGKAVKALKAEHIDLIHINGLDSSVAAKVAIKLGVPYVWHIRQFMEEDFGKRLYEEKRIYKLANQAASVIAISEDVRNKYKPLLGRDLDVVYNGVPTEDYVDCDVPRFDAKTLKLLLAGRISEQKGQMTAVKAVELLRGRKEIHTELTLVGQVETKEYMEYIENYIYEKHLDDRVKLLNHTDDLRSLRREHDIGLTCSKQEAFGRVTVENQMAGMLVVGADTGGTVEIIEDGITGFLYKEGDAENLADKIVFAIQNKEIAKKVALTGQKKAIKEYSIERVVNQLETIYNRVILR